MVVSFDEMPDDDYNELYGRIQKLKMEELFEEPSKYEDENEDDCTPEYRLIWLWHRFWEAE
jgi:hypothetical protein